MSKRECLFYFFATLIVFIVLIYCLFLDSDFLKSKNPTINQISNQPINSELEEIMDDNNIFILKASDGKTYGVFEIKNRILFINELMKGEKEKK